MTNQAQLVVSVSVLQSQIERTMATGSGSAHGNATSSAGDGADYSIKRTVGSICNVIPNESVERDKQTDKQAQRVLSKVASTVFTPSTECLTTLVIQHLSQQEYRGN